MLDATQAFYDRGPIAGRRAQRRRQSGEYRLYFAIVFAVALPIVLAGRLFPRRLAEAGQPAAARRSVLAEARALTDTVIPYLFMG